MKTLTEDQVQALIAYFEAIDGLAGVWPHINDHMTEFGIEDPETAVEEIRELLFS